MRKSMVYTRRLEKAGFSREQAESQISVFDEMIENGVASKDDLRILRGDFDLLRKDFESLGKEFDSLRKEFSYMQDRVVLRLGTIHVLSMGAYATFFKFFV